MANSSWYQFYVHNPIRNLDYYAINPIDEGGFGKVWNGVTADGLPVAIKIIKPSSDFLKDWDFWINEQNIFLRCLLHPHIICTFDQFVSTNNELVIIMEKAECSLKRFVSSERPLDPLSICSIGTQICHALHHIHSIGVVHRDVTLKNILWFPPNTFKLSDFGISKQGVSPEELARTFIGHRTFIPPELLLAGYSTHQSDIYQLGLVLLTLLVGAYPISLDATLEQTKQLILDGVPRTIAEGLVGQHGKLAEIIAKMLRRRDRFRFVNIMEVWQELYSEFKNRNRLKEIADFLKNQSQTNLPPWLKQKG